MTDCNTDADKDLQSDLYSISGVSQLHSSVKCNSTMITAYYNIQSKHSHEQYVEWMSNLLTVQDCLVIFTDPDAEETIRSLRPAAYPTIIIPNVR